MSETGTAQQRDERRAPALQEEEDDDDHEHERLDQRVHDLLHALGHGERGVERDDVVQVRRESFFDSRPSASSRPSAACDGVGAGELVERDDGGGLAVEPAADAVVLRAEFDARDILRAAASSRPDSRGRRSSPNSSARRAGGPARAPRR